MDYLDYLVISVQADNADIRSVLEQIKQQTGIFYLIKDNKQIVLSASESSQQQRNVTVHGTVTDTQGLPIIGANILERVQPTAPLQTLTENSL